VEPKAVRIRDVGRICIVVETIGVFGEIAEFLDVGLAGAKMFFAEQASVAPEASAHQHFVDAVCIIFM
jgi:hypothetical protein